MKLWRSKKTSTSTTSCVPGKLHFSKHTDTEKGGNDLSTNPATISITGDRAMSPAQSEDSGLAADRGTTYATISLPRENVQAMGIIFADRSDHTYPPTISTLNPSGPAADFLAIGDRIHQIDGISTIGLANNHILNVLLHGDGPAIIEIEYCLPEYFSQNSLCVQSKVAQITVERENGCLGLTLRGGGDVPLICTNVRPHGPIFKTGCIKPGDRLLRVDNISLLNKSLAEAQQILVCGHISGYTNLTIEYDVSVMQSVEFSMGPLLIEIERPMNDKLGLVLSNYSTILQQTNHIDHSKLDNVSPAGVYISSILPASIADRCGALSIGDQILSIDETVIENTAFSPDDVMAFLDAANNRGYTQIQIMPAHALVRRGLNCNNFGTLDSRKNTARPKKFTRKSSLPIDTSGGIHPNAGLCCSETIQVVLDCTHGSGLILSNGSPPGRGHIITQILTDSVAERSGCIQKGDRILSVNKLYNLDVATVRQILGDSGLRAATTTFQGTHWVELEIEFDMADTVIPSSGVFNVKLTKWNRNCGVGITVNSSAHGTYIIAEVKPGSPAHRTGSLRAGDILLAIDSHTLQHFNVDSLLKDNKSDLTTLTIKRNCLPDFLFDAQQRQIYNNVSSATTLNKQAIGNGSNGNITTDDNYGYSTGTMFKAQSCQPDYFHIDETSRQSTPVVQLRRPQLPKPNESIKVGYSVGSVNCGSEINQNNTQSLTTEITDEFNDLGPDDFDYHQRYTSMDSSNMPPPMEQHIMDHRHISQQHYLSLPNHQIVTNVRLETNGGPLGITLAGSVDPNTSKPIVISGVTDGGPAYNTRKIYVGDCLMAINGESVQGMPLPQAKKLLQNLGSTVDLKIARNVNEIEHHVEYSNLPQPQAVYAKIQRRPRSPSVNDGQSSSSGSSKDRFRSFQVTLYKDKVYDDYGFSVSDGLYERGVFINRIRSGGPADIVGLLKPFDRIMQVNGTKTQDFDCCLTVPLIASAGDKIDLKLMRTLNE